jgi:Na+-driven multidrug efflux pump
MHDDPEVFMATLTPLSLFSLSFLFVGHNVLYATYFSSVTKIRKSVAIVVLRGFVFVLASLFVSVSVLGNWGIWVSQPISEMATLMCSVMHKRQEEGKQIAQ